MSDWRANPRVGDVIRERRARRRARPAREVIEVDGERVLTTGRGGRQRNRWMGRANLSRYELIERGPE